VEALDIRRAAKRARAHPTALFVGLAFWGVVFSLAAQVATRDMQLGPAGIALFALLVGAAVMLSIMLLVALLQSPEVLASAAAASAVLFWFAVVGTAHWVQDTVVLGIAWIVVSFALIRPRDRSIRPPTRIRRVLIFWVPTFCAASVLTFAVDQVRSRARALVSPPAVEASVPPGGERSEPIVVALSGGGYRAALMHAGVLHQLSVEGRRVGAISSVSGGSILASYVASGRTPLDFLSDVQARRFNVVREAMLLPNLLRVAGSQRVPNTRFRLMPFAEFSRSHVQADMLDRVFLHDRYLSDLPSIRSGRLDVMLCATEIAEGKLLGIGSEGVLSLKISHVGSRTRVVEFEPEIVEPEFTYRSDSTPLWLIDSVPVSRIVAASGAFPGAFEPVRLEVTERAGGELVRRTMTLADGGIGDNLGLVLALGARYLARNAVDADARSRLASWNVGTFVASDASAIQEDGAAPQSVVGALVRSLDLVYRSTAGIYLLPRHVTRDAPATLVLSPRALLAESSVLAAVDDVLAWAERHPASTAAQLLADAGVDLPPATSPGMAPSDTAARRDHERRERLAGAVRDAVELFRSTSTLRDQFSAEEAQRLFWLGRVLVIARK